MAMSTISGFLLGAVAAAGLTVLYGEKLHHSFSDAALLSPDSLAAIEVLQRDPNTPAASSVKPATKVVPDKPPASIEQRWAEYAAHADSLSPSGKFPWRSCFARAAASYDLPESLLLAIARGESNFDPAARSDKDAVGLMQIRWPHTSRHLGVLREADLYDPCTNVDAGARYLQELAGRFDNNLHLTVAAYNYGPGAIAPDSVPEGARWYSQYIFGHLQKVLGNKQSGNTPPKAETASPAMGQLVVMSFGAPQRARGSGACLTQQIPDLNVQLRSDASGQHDVVLLYGSDAERQRALRSINAAGIVPLALSGTSSNYL